MAGCSPKREGLCGLAGAGDARWTRGVLSLPMGVAGGGGGGVEDGGGGDDGGEKQERNGRGSEMREVMGAPGEGFSSGRSRGQAPCFPSSCQVAQRSLLVRSPPFLPSRLLLRVRLLPVLVPESCFRPPHTARLCLPRLRCQHERPCPQAVHVRAQAPQALRTQPTTQGGPGTATDKGQRGEQEVNTPHTVTRTPVAHVRRATA